MVLTLVLIPHKNENSNQVTSMGLQKYKSWFWLLELFQKLDQIPIRFSLSITANGKFATLFIKSQ
jgi:hypothetical protein